MNTATTPLSRIVYRVRVDSFWIGDANSRDEAEVVVYLHANRNGRQITQGYTIDVELREEAT